MFKSLKLMGAMIGVFAYLAYGALAEETRFSTSSTVIWKGIPQVIPFRLSSPAEKDLDFRITSSKPEILNPLMAGKICKGRTTGYIRVKGVEEGEAVLKMNGGSLRVEVKALPVNGPPPVSRPRIAGPVPESTVWGSFLTAVDVAPEAGSRDRFPKVVLNILGEAKIQPQRIENLTPLARRYLFEVNCERLRPGMKKLEATSIASDGKREKSEPHVLYVVSPGKKQLKEGECEMYVLPLSKPDDPSAKVQVISHVRASGGRCTAHRGAQPVLAIPLHVEKAGWYQVMLRARGDYGGGAYPSIGVKVDKETTPRTSTRIVSWEWHRFPAGKPVYLTPGDHSIWLPYLNDFFARNSKRTKKSDRNLFLDRFEILRVDEAFQSASLKLPYGNQNVRVAFEKAWDGRIATSPITLRARVSVSGVEKKARKKLITALLLNGKEIAKQKGTHPIFHLSPSALQPGNNDLRLYSKWISGEEGFSVVQHLKKSPLLDSKADFPQVRICYPQEGSEAYGADAVIAEAADPEGLQRVDLEFDGKLQGYKKLPWQGAGKVLLPLLPENLTPGRHHIAIRVWNKHGKQTLSQSLSISVPHVRPRHPGRYSRAVYLLNHFAYGPEETLLAELLTRNETEWLTEQLNRPFSSLGDQASMANAVLQYPNDRSTRDVQSRVLAYALDTDNPVRLRYVLWLQNHFSTWIRKTHPDPKWEEYQAFLQLGPAPFVLALHTSATSPAMLRYLDQDRSTLDRINENYSRELMELHTLGVGDAYTQDDVTALAHLLTGWRCNKEAYADGRGGKTESLTFAYDPSLNEWPGGKIAGLLLPAVNRPPEGPARIETFLAMLAAHPATARHLAAKLWRHYTGKAAPAPVLDDLSRTYLETGGDMKKVLLALAQHPVFWSDLESRSLAPPLEMAIRMGRLGGIRSIPQALTFLNRSGTGLFDCESPAGFADYPQAYANTNVLLQSWNFMQHARPRLKKWIPQEWNLQDKAILHKASDLVSVRLTGHPLTPQSTDTLLEIHAKGESNAADISSLLLQMPELQTK